MGVVLKDTSKPSYEELMAEVAALKAAAAEKPRQTSVSFTVSKNNPKFWVFKHGVIGGGWPCTISAPAWRVLLANVDMIKSTLPK